MQGRAQPGVRSPDRANRRPSTMWVMVSPYRESRTRHSLRLSRCGDGARSAPTGRGRVRVHGETHHPLLNPLPASRAAYSVEAASAAKAGSQPSFAGRSSPRRERSSLPPPKTSRSHPFPSARCATGPPLSRRIKSPIGRRETARRGRSSGQAQRPARGARSQRGRQARAERHIAAFPQSCDTQPRPGRPRAPPGRRLTFPWRPPVWRESGSPRQCAPPPTDPGCLPPPALAQERIVPLALAP